MANVSDAVARAAFFRTFENAVKTNPGAVLQSEGGEIRIQLVPAKNGRVAWMKLEEAAEASESRKPKALEQQRASVQLRYDIAVDGKNGDGLCRLSLKPDHKARSYEYSLNRRRNAEVAEAFVRKAQASLPPGVLVPMTRHIRERLVELPGPVFASELARQSKGAITSARIEFPMRVSIRQAFEADVPGFALASYAAKEAFMAPALALWADDESAGLPAKAATDYMDLALAVLERSPSERQSRGFAVANLQVQLRAGGLLQSEVGAAVARFRNLGLTLKADDFLAQLKELQTRVDTEIAAAAAVSAAGIGEAAQALGSHMKELDAVGAQRPAKATEGESSSSFDERQRGWDSDFETQLNHRVDELAQSFGAGVDVQGVRAALQNPELHDRLNSPEIQATALKKFNVLRSDSVPPLKQDGLRPAYLNALTAALRQQPSGSSTKAAHSLAFNARPNPSATPGSATAAASNGTQPPR